MTDQITLAELAEKSGTPARTIRFYISRGLLDGPIKGGRGAAYTQAHVERLERIKALQTEGHTLSAVAAMLATDGRRHAVPASPWWQYQVADDVIVMARSDASPWRLREIRAAVDEMMKRLGKEDK